jgi:peptide-methionine (R)-S-oxide reductase
MAASPLHDPGRRQLLLGAVAAGALAVAYFSRRITPGATPEAAPQENFKVSHTDAEWRQLLSPSQYAVLRQEGTERPYSSPLNDEHRQGVFACAGCAQDLFSSATKFDSGTGWPSFWQPLPQAVIEHRDSSFGMVRTEVRCSRCGGHLGHVFDDGPAPTGLRYCMNGVAMNFRSANT